MIKKNKNTISYVIPGKCYLRLADIRNIVLYCQNGCNIDNKCKHYEKCIANSNFTFVKVFLQNDVKLCLTYNEYQNLEKVLIENNYIDKPIFEIYENNNSGR